MNASRPHHRRRPGGSGGRLAGRRGRRSMSSCTRCGRRAPPPPTRPIGSRNWCAATRSRANRNPARPGCSRRNFAGSDRCCSSRRPRPGCRAATRSPWTARCSPREVTAALEAHPRIEVRREEVDRAPGRRDRHHRHRPAHQRRAGRRHRPAHRLRAALLLRQHQPHRGRRVRSTTSIAFRASRYGKSLDATGDYLNCPFDRQQYERFVDALLEAQQPRAAHRRRRSLLRGLPAHRGTGAPRPRHAALRPHEARGPGRPAHRPPALRRRATAPGEPARRELQPGGLPELTCGTPEQARVFRLIPGLERARVPALRPDSPQHVHQRARAARAHAAVDGPSRASSSRARSPAWRATSSRSPPA